MKERNASLANGWSWLAVAVLATGPLGCSIEALEGASAEAYADHDEPSDFIEVPGDEGKADGVPASFSQNHIVDEAFFLDTTSFDADEVQAFLEHTVYGYECFLAREWIGGRPVSEVLVETAQRWGINPLVLLTRMQVEKSLISKSTRPAANVVDFALGCGCHDGQACYEQYAGLANQLECSARVFVEQHGRSVDATGWWQAGRGRQSEDHYWVVPVNHATAAMYGYTPWVLPNRGGNWLVWNVTRLYVRHCEQQGYLP